MQPVVCEYPFSSSHFLSLILFQLPLSGRRFCYMDHVLKEGERFFAELERIGLEAMVAKKLNSVYVSGMSRDWLDRSW